MWCNCKITSYNYYLMLEVTWEYLIYTQSSKNFLEEYLLTEQTNS